MTLIKKLIPLKDKKEAQQRLDNFFDPLFDKLVEMELKRPKKADSVEVDTNSLPSVYKQ